MDLPNTHSILVSYTRRICHAESNTALVKKDGDWWIGWIEEIPRRHCQEETQYALMKSLKETLLEAIEFNRMDAIDAAGSGYKEEIFAVMNRTLCLKYLKSKAACSSVKAAIIPVVQTMTKINASAIPRHREINDLLAKKICK
jgi:hypothetical protein